MTPFLLIPGLNATARVYRDVAETLWPHGPVVHANHLQGEGMQGIAARILADAPPKFALMGFSFGGYLSFEILRQAPERVSALALIDTSARADTAESIANRRRRLELAAAGKFSLVLQQSFPNSVHPDNAEDSALIAVHRSMGESNGPEVYRRHQEAIIERLDSRPELGAIHVPTLVLVGEADAITPVEVAREMHEGIAGSQLVVVPDAGHLALLEKPLPVNAAVKAWAESLSGR